MRTPNARPQSKQQYDRPTRSPIHASPQGSSRTPATPSISHYARTAHERLHPIVDFATLVAASLLTTQWPRALVRGELP
jgi:hypothetical protein